LNSVGSLFERLALADQEFELMVRLQKRLARKRYLRSKRVYEYERISLNIPKEFHEMIRQYLEEDLEMKVATERGSLTIVLTPLKTLRHAANYPAKT
jgi:CO dehydrogenase/acetyl-CoA synthase beta subunit